MKSVSSNHLPAKCEDVDGDAEGLITGPGAYCSHAPCRYVTLLVECGVREESIGVRHYLLPYSIRRPIEQLRHALPHPVTKLYTQVRALQVFAWGSRVAPSCFFWL